MRQDTRSYRTCLLRHLPAWAVTPGFLQFVRYVLVGGFTTAINVGLMALLHGGLHWNENLSNVISVVCAVLFAYLASKWFVFRTHCVSKGDFVREMLTFFSARAVTMLVEIGGLFLLVTQAGLPWFWIKLALTILVIVLNFVFSKLFVFRPGR